MLSLKASKPDIVFGDSIGVMRIEDGNPSPVELLNIIRPVVEPTDG